MNLLRRLAPHLWIVVLVAALALTFASHSSRVARVDHITGLHHTGVATDPGSPTGYEGGLRMLIAPGHNDESYQWIVQTQQMLAEGTWRVRHAAYDNAPDGRPVETPSPYRWWLALVAWVNHAATGNSPGLAVERAALWSDPVLHLLAMAGAALFAARRFGRASAILLTVAMASAFPFSGMFVAGAPEDTALTQVFVLASLLALLAGALPGITGTMVRARWFAAAGVCGGLALWLSPNAAVPIVAGLGLGGLVAAGFAPRNTDPASPATPLPWRWWGIAGGATTACAYLLEFAPDHLAWHAPGLVEVHPLYAIAWIGYGECIHRVARRLQGGALAAGWRGWIIALSALSAGLALPVAMVLTPTQAFLTPENFATRFTALGDGIQADSLLAWLARDGVTPAFWAAVLPLAIAAIALMHLLRGRRGGVAVSPPTILLVPALIATGLAFGQLSWWAPVGTVLLSLIAAVSADACSAPFSRTVHGGVIVLVVSTILPGAGVARALSARAPDDLSPLELRSLLERDVAHWLALRNTGESGIILAPPDLTTSLIYHGGQRGVGSTFRENSKGFAAAVRLCAASSADEARALAERRGLTQIVLPTWDPFLVEYASLGAKRLEDSLVGMLQAWLPPLWLEPVAYELPPLSGYTEHQAFVFEMTELQDLATSWSRMAEYFLDMGDIPLATELCEALAERHGDNLGGMIAAARAAIARRDQYGFSRVFKTIVARVDEGEGETLPWDRRVSLSLVLSVGQRPDLARTEAEFCLDFAGEREWRRLAVPALKNFLRLCHTLELTIPDPDLRRLAESRLPQDVATKS